MKRYRRKFLGLLTVFSLILASGVFFITLRHTESAFGVDNKAELGKRIYEERCLVCHGGEGDGKGFAGVFKKSEFSGRVIDVYPRDFTLGVFRFRSTPTGCLPTMDDLMYIIDNGITRSFMPPHKEELTREEKEAVIEHMKSFSEWWETMEPCPPIEVKKPDWVGSPKSVEKGKKVFNDMKCWECHGYEGKGDGPKSDKLQDDWGNQIWAFDFTTGALKRGTTPENIYMTYITGLDGTGMPSYQDSIPNEDDRWHLVSYTLKLMGMTGSE